MNKLSDFLVGFDIYGHQIGVNYKGGGTFNTRLGALCTLVTYTLMLVNMSGLLIDWADDSRWEVKTNL